MRIATWNLNGRAEAGPARAWLRKHNCDVALLQEAHARHWPSCVRVRDRIEGRKWCTLAWSSGPVLTPLQAVEPRYGSRGRQSSIVDTWPGSVAAATTHLADGTELTLVSLYAVQDNAWAYTTLHKQLSDLTYLLFSPQGRNVVIAGDFNGGTQGGQSEPPRL